MYGNETALLGFHLANRLTVPEHIDQVFIDDSFGQTIDADYPNLSKKLSLKFGIKIIDEITEDIIRTGDASLFRLFSVIRGMSGGSAKELNLLLKRVEGMLRRDGEAHDATMVFDDVALTFIIANDPVIAKLRLDALRQKRDQERKYAQEYILVLSPRAQSSDHSKRTVRHKRHHFVIRAVAMKQSSAGDDGILAFSPRISEHGWHVRDEPSQTHSS